MRGRFVLAVAVCATALPMFVARAEAPAPELGVVHPEAAKVISGPCVQENAFDVDYENLRPAAVRDNCRRLKIVFGPIWAKPGQNDVLIQPVTFEKPQYDGYMVRFKPDLVAVDPTRPGFSGDIASPPVEDLHLHHGTWLNPGYFGSPSEYLAEDPVVVPNPGRRYGWGPWLATGEEKTVAIWPEGFGLKIKASDAWLFLHMVHSAVPRTFPVWVTYDVDYIPADVAEAAHPDDATRPLLFKTKGIWLDVGDCNGWSADGCEKDSFNPIFNIQRGFGSNGICAFPAENCASQNTFAGTSTQQGIDKGYVTDTWEIPEDGTLVMMGGHLHNGGIRDDVYLVRNGQERLIHRSDAHYFDHNFNPDNWVPADAMDPTKSEVGAPPTSWDFVMSGVTSDTGWMVEVKAGDKLRLEGIYENSIASWYEQMGIVMTWLAPKSVTRGAIQGIDPFDTNVTLSDGINTSVLQPGTHPERLPGYPETCTPGASTLCRRGQITHARVPTSGNHANPCLNGCPDIAGVAPDGPVTTDIPFGGFRFGAADFGVIDTAGVPTVPMGESVTFWNLDTAAYMWHTITRCALPCSGTTVTQYPIADGAYDDLIVNRAAGTTADDKTVADLLAERGPDPMDFDSGQLGIGTGATNNVEWTWTPERAGTYAFWCRIHPSMRGAVRVV